ncbi:MAG: hypothetical protein AAB706_00960 [Patescibacteria group bacterium]
MGLLTQKEKTGLLSGMTFYEKPSGLLANEKFYKAQPILNKSNQLLGSSVSMGLNTSMKTSTPATSNVDVNPIKGALGFGKTIGQSLARFAVSAGESVPRLLSPKLSAQIIPPTKIPGAGFLGPIQSYQSETAQRVQEGESQKSAILKSAFNVAIDEPVGFAVKPLFIGAGILFRKVAGTVAKEVAGEGVKQALSALDEFLPLAKRALIKNPEITIRIGSVADDISKTLGLSNADVVISRKALKHIAESRGNNAIDIVKAIPKIIADPDKVADNSAKRIGSLLFVKKLDDSSNAVVFEIAKRPDGVHQVVSAFPMKIKDFFDLTDISGRTAPGLHVRYPSFATPKGDIQLSLSDVKDTLPKPSTLPDNLQPLANKAVGETKTGERTYKIIKQEGIREVKGEPVKIVDGVDTFIHKGTGGWVVSETSTGRYLADSVSREGAIAKAKFNISNVGEDKFRKLISEKQLSKVTGKEGILTKARQMKTSREIPSLEKTAQEFTATQKQIKAQTELLEQSTVKLGGKVDSLSTKQALHLEMGIGDSYIDNIPKSANDVKPPSTRGGITAPKLNFLDWKDRSALSLSRETLERNLEGVAGKEAQQVKDFIVNPTRVNETARSQFLNTTRKEIKEKIVKGKGIRSGSKEDALIQKFGEGNMTIEELKKSTSKWREVEESAQYFRAKYDELLDMVNKAREKFDYKPIPKRKDYFRHFQEIDGAIRQFGLLLREQDLPTEIAGLTGIFNPGKPFSTAELRRFGTKTTESAIKGMDNYLDSISRQIYHIDSVQRGRNLEKYIREAAKVDNKVKLPNFVANLHEYTNLVSGKKAAFDRAFESVLGRPFYGVMNWIRGRTSANMIGGNISSAITNFIPFTQSLATTGKIHATQGIFESLTSPFKKVFSEIDGVTSSFLTRRFRNEVIDPRGFKKAAQFANFLFKTIDQFTSKSIVAGKYFENLAKGMSKTDAMRLADEFAGKVLADRSIGQLPNLMNTRTLGVVTQFQTEVNNAFSFMTKDIAYLSGGNKRKIASSLAQLTVYSYLFNSAYEQITGRRPTLDPIHAALTLAGLTSEGEEASIPDRLIVAAKDIGENLPFVGGITGGRLPISAAIPDITALAKGETTLKKEILKPATFLLPPFGGSQLKKTIEGVGAFNRGASVSQSGKVRYPIEQTPENRVRTGLFGQYATKEAREYFNKKQTPLSEKQSEFVLNSPNKKEAFEQVKREQAEAKAKAEKREAFKISIYQKVQDLVGQGRKQEAQKVINGLSDADYEMYKDIRASERAKRTEELRTLLNRNPAEAVKFLRSQTPDEQQRLLKLLSDEEYKQYEEGKKQTQTNFSESYARSAYNDYSQFFNPIKKAKSKEFISKVPQKTLLDYIKDVKDNIPFFESRMGKAMKEQALSEYPFEDSIKELLRKKSLIKDTTPTFDLALKLSKNDGEISVGFPQLRYGGSSSVGRVADYVPFGRKLLEMDSEDDTLTKFGGLLLKESGPNRIKIKVPDSITITHELIHAVMDKRGMVRPPHEFNTDWDKLAKTDERLQVIDSILKESGLYHDIENDEFDLANERLAYLGAILGNRGLSNFPKELQKYFVGIFKNLSE